MKSLVDFKTSAIRASQFKNPIIPLSLILILLQQKVLGGDFFNKVCGHLKLLEKEYFGLEFRHHSGSYVRQRNFAKYNSRKV